MKGDSKLTKLIEASVYGTKHVHYFSKVSEEMKWDVKEKGCLNFEEGKVKTYILTHEIHQQIQQLNGRFWNS